MTDLASSLAAGDTSFLPEDALQEWLPTQRWFASKSQQLAGVGVTDAVMVRDESPLLVLALLTARFTPGTQELYQVPIGLRPVDEGWDEGVICQAGGWVLYDAFTDPALARELPRLMAASVSLPGDGGSAIFCSTEQAGGAMADDVPVRVVGEEQSNSSIVFGDALIMKSFRRLEAGVNPDLEMLRFLSAHGFPHIAKLHGWYEYEGRLIDATLGILQEFLQGAVNGWRLALDELDSSPEGFLDKLESLGRVTGEMHTVLGSDASDPAFSPDEPSTEALSLLTATVDEQIERVFVDLPEDERLADIAGRGQDVREQLQALSQVGVGGRVIRTHGDYHLGQTMYCSDGTWVIVDFEGEPARPLPERRVKRSPLRDVAGMLRSFAYAASAAKEQRGVDVPDDWEDRARRVFLDSYLAAVDPSLLPPGTEAAEKLLAMFELEKAVYELRYELNNRPDWIGIPAAGIARLLETG
jgi:trehalose synthase-fused probable maltokinase